VLIHSEIESHTGGLLASYEQVIAGARDRHMPTMVAGLRHMKDALERIIVSQLKMFNASKPDNYNAFVRPWIFGWKGNPDFPNGE
jgi:hypothetical protein